MELQINSLQANSARRVEEDGDEYLVAEGVTIGRSLYLDGGYVPAEEWSASVGKWDGVPLPVGHPVDADGNLISANDQPVLDSSVIGRLRNPREADPDGVTGDLWINVSDAQSVGEFGQRVLDILESDGALDVSSAYYSDDAPAGEYDGEYRTEAVQNLRPDHVALLPDPLPAGRCSIEDGCGITPTPDAGETADGGGSAALAANAATVYTPGTDTAGSGGRASPSVAHEPGETEAELGMQDTDGEPEGVDPDDDGRPPDGRGAAQITIQLPDDAPNGDYEGTAHIEQSDGTVVIRPTSSDTGASPAANVRQTPRTPTYSGTTTGEWDAPSLNDYIDAFATEADSDATEVADLSQESKTAIAEKTLMGDARATDAENLRSFPVVTTGNGLHEGALDAVLSRAPQADYLSESQVDALQTRARSLLNEEFDRDLDVNADTDGDTADGSAGGAGSSTAGHTECSCGGIAAGAGVADPESANAERGLLARIRDLVGGTSGAELAEDDCQCHTADAETETEQTHMTINTLSDDDYETLAANSAWDADELRADDDIAEKVAETVDLHANSDDESGDGGDADEDGDGESDDDGAEAEREQGTESTDVPDEHTPEGTTVPPGDFADMKSRLDDIEAQNETLRETVESREETIQRLAEEREAELIAGTDFESVDEALAANSEFTEEDIASMDRQMKEKTVRSVLPDAGRAQSGTDFGGLGSPSANMNDVHANSGDEEDEGEGGSTHGGSFKSFVQNSSSSSDD